MKKLVLLVALVFSYSAFSNEIYLLKTKIGDNVFNDIMVIDSYGIATRTAKGSLTVPGVFTAVMEKTSVVPMFPGTHLRFDIRVRENSEEYLVTYALFKPTQTTTVRGEIIKDGKTMGTVEGSLIFKE